MWSDLRYSFRALTRELRFTLAAIAIMSAGLAGAAVFFSVIDSWIFNPFRFDRPGDLLHIRGLHQPRGRQMGVSLQDLVDMRSATQSIESLAAWSPTTYTLSFEEQPERVRGTIISANFFDTLRVRPALGAGFRAEHGEFGRHRVAVVSDEFWKTRLGARPDAVGSTLRLDGDIYTVTGVMPPDFHFTLTGRSAVWIPLAAAPADAGKRGSRNLTLLARLRPGATAQQAASELNRVAAELARRYPETNTGIAVFTASLLAELGEHTGSKAILLIFGVAVGLMLVASANVANLMLVRATGRRRQAAIQYSMGANRANLMRQAVGETLIVFTIAGLIAAAGSTWITDWVSASIPFENRGFLPNYGMVSLNWRVFAFCVAAAALSGLLFGLMPAWESGRTDVNAMLKASGSNGPGRGRLRNALVVTQIALSMILLSATGLLVWSFQSQWSAPLKFDEKGVLTFRLSLDPRQFSTPSARRLFFERVTETLPAAGAVARFIPFGSDSGTTTFRVVGGGDVQPSVRPQRPTAQFNSVTPAFFSTLRIPVRSGRVFEAGDGAGSPPVVVINETMAQRHFPGLDPVGRRLAITRLQDTVAEVIGVVGDIRTSQSNQPPEPDVYVPFAQSPFAEAHVLIRTDGDPLALVPAVRKSVSKVDPGQPVFNTKSLQELMHEQYAPFKIMAGFLTGFGLLALALAAIGVYCVVAFAVSQRTREYGIRIALGADRGRLLRLVLSQGVILLLWGLVPGVAGAAAAIVWLRTLASEILPVVAAPPLIPCVALVLTLAALAAMLIPAGRAASVEPVSAIRQD